MVRWLNLEDPDSEISLALAEVDNDNVHALTDDDGVQPSVRYILNSERASWKEFK